MANARDFGSGQTEVFARTLVWKREIGEYGNMREKIGRMRSNDPYLHRLMLDASNKAHELAVRIAKLELDAQNCATCLHAQWVTEDWGWCEVAETTDRGHALESLARARTQEGKPASLHIERHYGCVQWEGEA